MKYLGGKHKIANQLAKVMLDTIKNINSQPTNYYEPFVGGASVAVSMAKLNPSLNMHLSDIEPNLIIPCITTPKLAPVATAVTSKGM